MAKRTVTNTKAEMESNPMRFGLEAMIAGGSNAIEAQERRGQREVEMADELPMQGSEHPAWAKMGVVMGSVKPDDPLFREATLPQGWKKVRTDHSLYTNLVDDKGRVRGSIGYKAAFYDRWAQISPTSRFSVRKLYPPAVTEAISRYVVLDGDRQIFETEAVSVAMKNRRDYAGWNLRQTTDEKLHAVAVAWLVERYPDWTDPAAHWDDEPAAAPAVTDRR